MWGTICRGRAVGTAGRFLPVANEKRSAGVTPPTLPRSCRPGCPVPPHFHAASLGIKRLMRG
jgi:hypothetical protein